MSGEYISIPFEQHVLGTSVPFNKFEYLIHFHVINVLKSVIKMDLLDNNLIIAFRVWKISPSEGNHTSWSTENLESSSCQFCPYWWDRCHQWRQSWHHDNSRFLVQLRGGKHTWSLPCGTTLAPLIWQIHSCRKCQLRKHQIPIHVGLTWKTNFSLWFYVTWRPLTGLTNKLRLYLNYRLTANHMEILYWEMRYIGTRSSNELQCLKNHIEMFCLTMLCPELFELSYAVSIMPILNHYWRRYLLKIEDIMKIKALKLYYRYKQNELPKYFDSMFTESNDSHSHNTTHKSLLYQLPTKKTGTGHAIYQKYLPKHPKASITQILFNNMNCFTNLSFRNLQSPIIIIFIFIIIITQLS